MTSLAAGVILKLLNGMETGVKPTSEHRSSLLQVTDIVPADLDEKSLFPKRGFFIKLSDSSHSVYVALPSDQHDIVFTNKLQLGQFIYLDRLDPGSPVPVIRGAKPIPGRHPFVGTPEPLASLKHLRTEPEKRAFWNHGSTPLDFQETLPGFGTPLPTSRKRSAPEKKTSHIRSSFFKEEATVQPESPRTVPSNIGTPCGVLKNGSRVRGSIHIDSDVQPDSPAVSERSVPRIFIGTPRGALRKSCVAGTPLGRSKSVTDRAINSPLKSSVGGLKGRTSATPPPRARNPLTPHRDHSSSKSSANILGKLSLLGKEAVKQRDEAQKVALQALKDAAATEAIVRSVKMFSNLSRSAKAEAPGACIDQFLEFHGEITRAMSEMASIEEISGKNEENMRPSIWKAMMLGKQIEEEAGGWFMEFLEKALEKGMKRSGDEDGKKVRQSVMLKLINWIEMEQHHHPKGNIIARKLRIKMKNP